MHMKKPAKKCKSHEKETYTSNKNNTLTNPDDDRYYPLTPPPIKRYDPFLWGLSKAD